MEVTTVGLDVAKRVFQAHGADASGKAVLRRKLQRPEVLKFFASMPRCLVGIEACSTAHHRAREIMALGHQVRLMPASSVKPYVKRGKTDADNAEAICEAVTRPALVQMKGLSQVCWHAALGEGRQWASRRASTNCSKAGTSTAR